MEDNLSVIIKKGLQSELTTKQDLALEKIVSFINDK